MRTQPLNLDYMHPKEGAMMQQQLSEIIRDASSLRSALHPDDNVPAWTQFKVSTAQDRLHAASGYLTNKINLIVDEGVVRADFGAIDEFLSDAMDLSGKEERSERRVKRAGKRYDRKKRDKAKLRILLRTSYKVAKTNKKRIKRGFLGSRFRQAVRYGDRALDKGKSMHFALVSALVYLGLSKSDAEKNATFTIASVEAGSYKAGHDALKKKYPKKTAKTATATSTEVPAYDPNEFVSADTEYTEDTELPENGEEMDAAESDEENLEGFGVPSGKGTMLDQAKPYLPWIALGFGIMYVVHASTQNRSKK